jgi:hypothetical protein
LSHRVEILRLHLGYEVELSKKWVEFYYPLDLEKFRVNFALLCRRRADEDESGDHCPFLHFG